MSGHNKWSTIKNKKGKEDAKKGKIFTKMGRMIQVAVRDGGADPEYNPSLKAAIEKAKSLNMPNDNIDRAIKKASGENGLDTFENILYEGYGPEGIAVIVSCLTDNKNRTAADVRHAFDKFGGNMGTNGSVTFMFDYQGLISIDKEKNGIADEEELMMEVLEAGADDMTEEEGIYQITTSKEAFNDVRDSLSEKYTFDFVDLTYLPKTYNKIEDEENIRQMVKMLETLEDNDDVQDVYHNWDVPDDLELED